MKKIALLSIILFSLTFATQIRAQQPLGYGGVLTGHLVKIEKYLPNGDIVEINPADSRSTNRPDIIAAPAAGPIVFDTITNVTAYSLPNATRTFMGEPYNLAAGTTDLSIATVDTKLVSAAAVNYTNLQLRIAFWGAANTATTPVFSSPIATYTFNFGAATLAANSVYDITNLTTLGLILPSANNQGITFNWSEGGVSTDNLSTAVRATTAIAVGSVNFASPNFGYYRNASARTDFNFASTDSRSLGANTYLAYRLYNYAPTAAGVSVSGKVLTSGGKVLANMIVSLKAADGSTKTARTNSFGNYNFNDVESGRTYVVSVSPGKNVFDHPAQVISVQQQLTAVNFIAK